MYYSKFWPTTFHHIIFFINKTNKIYIYFPSYVPLYIFSILATKHPCWKFIIFLLFFQHFSFLNFFIIYIDRNLSSILKIQKLSIRLQRIPNLCVALVYRHDTTSVFIFHHCSLPSGVKKKKHRTGPHGKKEWLSNTQQL